MYARITVSSRPTVDTKYPRAQLPPQLSVQRLAPALRDEDHVVLAFPARVVETPVVVHRNSSSCGFGGSRGGVPLFAPGTVKLRLPPRQSRGVSYKTLANHHELACELALVGGESGEVHAG